MRPVTFNGKQFTVERSALGRHEFFVLIFQGEALTGKGLEFWVLPDQEGYRCRCKKFQNKSWCNHCEVLQRALEQEDADLGGCFARAEDN
jgi:hypothetical protein